MNMTPIGEMRSQITLRRWAYQQDEAGGSEKVLTATWSVRAKVEDRSGTIVNPQSQDQWKYDYRISFYYEPSRIVISNDTIDYDGKRLRINSLSIKEEGMRREVIARCSTIENLPLDTSLTTYKVRKYDYTGTSGENTFSHASLIGKSILGAFKDGLEYQVILTGTPTGKQVKYNSISGGFLWSDSFEPGEHGLIQFTDV